MRRPLTTQEIRVVLTNLNKERERLHEELLRDPDWAHRPLEAPDYKAIIEIRDALIEELERRTL